jgi:hypothetical protein
LLTEDGLTGRVTGQVTIQRFRCSRNGGSLVFDSLSTRPDVAPFHRPITPANVGGKPKTSKIRTIRVQKLLGFRNAEFI